MARLIHPSDSASKCLNYTRRHQRLTKQVVNNNGLIEQIQVPATVLKEKVGVLNGKETAREDAYDDLILSDKVLDDTIRSVYEDCKKYDRSNLGERVLIRIFPDETFGEIIRLPFSKEVTEVEQTAIRIESLGTDHELYPLAAVVKEYASNCKNAIDHLDESIKEVKLAEAEVDIAKEALILNYESNYLEARKQYGKITTEKLFPKVYSTKSSSENEKNSDSKT